MSERTGETDDQVADPSRPDLGMDWERLHRLADGNPEFELELLGLFLEDTRERLEQVRQAIATQNLPRFIQETHHIKGASANVGAKPIWSAITQLEQQSQQQSFSQASDLIAQIEVTLAALQSYVDSASE